MIHWELKIVHTLGCFTFFAAIKNNDQQNRFTSLQLYCPTGKFFCSIQNTMLTVRIKILLIINRNKTIHRQPEHTFPPLEHET